MSPTFAVAVLKRGGHVMLCTRSGAANRAMPIIPFLKCLAASHGLMHHVATGFGPRGMSANVIAPGLITHEWFERTVDAAHGTRLAQDMLVGGLDRPADIAAMTALLTFEAES